MKFTAKYNMKMKETPRKETQKRAVGHHHIG
jgi:hypothetical protein